MVDYGNAPLSRRVVYRRRNLADLFIGKTLLRLEDAWIVDIPGEKVKNSEPLLAELPTWLGERVDDFISIYWPLIARSGSHSGLWASAKGRPSTPGALYVSFRTAVMAALNLPLTLHDVRSIGYTTWAIHDPANAAGAKDLLADRSERVSQAYYNLASGIKASRVLANIKRRQSASAG